MKEMVSDVSSFKAIFRDLIILGLPLPWDENGEIHFKQTYVELPKNKINDDMYFNRLTRVFIGEDIMDFLAMDFEIIHQLKGVFRNLHQPSYETYTNLEEIVRNMNKTNYHMGNSWHYIVETHTDTERGGVNQCLELLATFHTFID
jgi:hypothetical protein